MKRTITIYNSGHAYLGKGVAADGYVGEIDALFNAVTITLIKPGTTTEDVIKSLELTIAGVKLRAAQGNKANNEGI